MTSETTPHPDPIPAAAAPAPVAYPARPTSALAVVSLVTGIVSWIMLPFVASVVAVICGHMARREIRDSGGHIEGDGLAIAGLVLGWVNIALCVLTLLGILLFFGGLALLLGAIGLGSQL